MRLQIESGHIRRIVILVGWSAPLVFAACLGGPQPEADEYYQAYVMLQAEVTEIGTQLDSAMIAIRDLETALSVVRAELSSAAVSAREVELMIPRDPASAEFHIRQVQERLSRAEQAINAIP